MEHSLRAWILIGIAVLLTACGGGGGGGSITPPEAPANLTVVGDDGFNTIEWASVSDATSYNIYWLDSTGVTKDTGNKISGVTSPLKHGGLVNGIPYFYVVTAVNGGGESSESAEATDNPVNSAGTTDPLFVDQWHLKNTGQLGNDGVAAIAGEDINVEPVWNTCGTGNTCRGEGVRVAVVDDGLEIAHEDLAANIAAGQSYNYLDASSDPTPPNDVDSHGTKVGGIIAARDMNDLGVRGVAPRANLVGYNVLQSPTESNLAGAMTRDSSDVYVSSNSWGPPDFTGDPLSSSFAWRTAINTGLSSGRGGKGTIYVWAGGNGANGAGPNVDNSNYDGYANTRGIIAVGAVTDQGTQAFYSERGANLLVSAPGGEFCDSHTISTTDLSGVDGDNASGTLNNGVADYVDANYTKCMNGTSAATPMVSGVVALMLQANPDLGWRDVHSILARTARKNDASNADWSVNGAGLDISHNFGFGVVDADAAVSLATTWVNLTSEIMSTSLLYSVNTAIPDNNTAGIVDTVTISGSGISEIESIEIIFSSTNHTYTGDLEITLTNITTGTVSRLSEEHLCLDSSFNVVRCNIPYDSWIFSSVRHLGEAADGDWTLTVKDLAPLDTGTFQSWRLKFYGT